MTELMCGSGVLTLSRSSLVSLFLMIWTRDPDFQLDDFFVGIGDINSTFLPKLDPITSGTPLPTGSLASSSKSPSSSTLSASLPETPIEPSTPERAYKQGTQEAKQMVAAKSLTLEVQLEERPLAKQQEALLDEGSETSSSDNKKIAGADTANIQDKPGQGEKHTPKALLKNDDVELQRVNNVRQTIFLAFFIAGLILKAGIRSGSHTFL